MGRKYQLGGKAEAMLVFGAAISDVGFRGFYIIARMAEIGARGCHQTRQKAFRTVIMSRL